MAQKITVAETANYLGITRVRLYQLEQEGIVQKDENGEYDLKQTFKSFIDYKVNCEKKKNEKKEQKRGDPDYRLKEYNAELKRLELEKAQSRLIDADEVLESWSRIVIRTRKAFMDIKKLAPRLKAMTSVKNIYELLDAELTRILKELANEGSKK